MEWDRTRPVPWRRLVRDWLVFAVIMTVVFAVVARDELAGALAAVAVSLPAYLAIAGVLAKFGYVRKTMAEQRVVAERRRAERLASRSGGRAAEPAAVGRARPAPTRRTSTGPSQRPRRTTRGRRR